MMRRFAVFLLSLVVVANSVAAEEVAVLSALDRIDELLSKVCLSGGSSKEFSIVSKGDSLDVSGSAATVTIKKNEAQGLIGGLSPGMTAVQAAQASEVRNCKKEMFLVLVDKLRAWAVSSARTDPIVHRVEGDNLETTFLGKLSAGRNVTICVQNRDLFEDANVQLIARLARVFMHEGELTNEAVDFQPATDGCLSDRKPGRTLRAHVFQDGDYSIVTSTKMGENGAIGFFEWFVGRPTRWLLKAVFGFPYNSVFTLEIRIQ